MNWKKACCTKEKGGLGIKNIELFNKSLLLKLKWRILQEKEAIWPVLLKYRYCNSGFILMSREGRSGSSRDSIWWRDLVSLGHNCGQDFNLFTDNVKCDLGSGLEISFWNNKWMGTQNLKESFPGLFVISRLSFGNVTDMGEWTGSNWSWNC